MDDHSAKPAILSALSDAEAEVRRRCVCCGDEYSIASYFDTGQYFDRPTDFARGCVTHCLGCGSGSVRTPTASLATSYTICPDNSVRLLISSDALDQGAFGGPSPLGDAMVFYPQASSKLQG